IINTPDETGLIRLYGEPGTGKSSVIKNLITQDPDTEFVFIDDGILGSVPQSALISYFIDNQYFIL
ncbi:MAG: ATP-binding protein, partial [Muribaculaceae bacterium]|nr:ATP-binding protein [Muribaculaceae bacterium]